MKYYRGTILLITGLFLAVLIIPNLVSAQTSGLTPGEIKALISKLQEQIKELQAQLDKLQGTTTAWCHDFNVNLRIGDSGAEVEALRLALIKEGFSLQAGGEFDEELASAVSGFQEKYRSEILAPLGLKNGTGYVGKATRAKLNSLYGCGVVRPRPVPLPTPIPTPSPTPSFLTVISPNGGERWLIGSGYSIRWNQAQSELVSIWLQNKTLREQNEAGYYLKPIVGELKGKAGENVYNWTISKDITPVSGYEICVAGHFTVSPDVRPAMQDDCSDAPFSIVSPTATLTITTASLPNATIGQKYVASITAAGGTYTYSWQITQGSLPPGLYLDSLSCLQVVGIPCQTPATISGTPTTAGTYTFTVTVTSGTQTASKEFTIVVNTATTVQPSLTVLSPNGGERWEIGKTYTISWNSSGIESVNIELENWEGAPSGGPITWRIASGVSAALGKYSWTIPANIFPAIRQGDFYKVRIVDAKDTSITYAQQKADSSDYYFSIVSPADRLTITTASLPDATVGQPYKAVAIEATGGTDSYDWRVSAGSLPPGLTLVRAYCVMFPCQVPVTISGTPTTAGTYTFTVTVTSGTQSASKQFTIVVNTTTVQPSISVTDPSPSGVAGGLTISPGSTYTIRWISSGVSKVLIYVCDYYGSCFRLANVPEWGVDALSGAHEWYVDPNHPLFPGYNLRIKVVDASNSSVFGYSGYFEVSSSSNYYVTVVSPNGGEKWTPGSWQTITWNAGVGVGAVNIELVRGSAKTLVTTIANNFKTTTVGSYLWKVTKDVPPASDYFVRVSNSSNSLNYDLSDSSFTISENQRPIGYLDVAGCDTIGGWAYDPDTPWESIKVHLYDGGAGVGTFLGEYITTGYRADVNSTYGISGNHGFTLSTPASLKDGNVHYIYAYGIDSAGGFNPDLTNSPMKLQCAVGSTSILKQMANTLDSLANLLMLFRERLGQ
jgi:hypothetical protein